MADLLKAIKDIEPITVTFIVKKHLVMENTLRAPVRTGSRGSIEPVDFERGTFNSLHFGEY